MKPLTLRITFILLTAVIGVAQAQTNLICRLAPGITATSIANKYGITLVDYTQGAPFAIYSGVSDDVQNRMEQDKSLVWEEDDEQVGDTGDQAHGKPTKGGSLPAVGSRSTLQQVNKNILKQIDWDSTIANASGRSIHVAILDTGIGPSQKALWSKVDGTMNVIEPGKPAYDIPHHTDSNNDGIPDEAVGHGTMIAGIVDLISPKSRFYIARITDSDGMATGWNVIKGLAYSVASHADVVNISLGGLSSVPALSDVMDWCLQNNVVVVAPIGNNALNAVCYPAKLEGVICVGGVDAANQKASFSNWGTRCQVSAPAVGFASQFWDGGLAVWSGTSFASPVVAASVAEALRHTSSQDNESLAHKLTSTGATLTSLLATYKGQLGVLVDFAKLVNSFNRP